MPMVYIGGWYYAWGAPTGCRYTGSIHRSTECFCSIEKLCYNREDATVPKQRGRREAAITQEICRRLPDTALNRKPQPGVR